MPETPLANSDAARSPTGEIKSVETPAQTTETTTTSTTETPKPAELGATLLTEGDKTKTEEKPADKTVPDKYDFKLPDDITAKGFTLDPAAVERASPIFKDLGLTQAQAQTLVNFYASETQKLTDSTTQRVLDQNAAWVTEVKADPEIGGKLDQVKTTISKALDGLGDAKLATSFREAMDLTGAGNNPAFIRTLYKLAQKVTEGHAVTGNGPAATGQRSPNAPAASVANRMYPNLP